MAYCKRCSCGHVMIYEEFGGAPLRCPTCSRFIAFLKEEVYTQPENMEETGQTGQQEIAPQEETGHEPAPGAEKKRFVITLEAPDGELILPVEQEMLVGRNAAGKEYLGQFPDVTRQHLTIAPRANGITATLTDHSRYGTFVNGKRMIKESSVVVSNYSEIRLASKAILLVRVKEEAQDA